MHAHVHNHGHANENCSPRNAHVLRISLFVTLAYIVVLVITGLKAHSLALISEAAHNVSDFLALLLSLFAVYMETRPPSATKTYGYSRAGVIAAFVNSAGLVLLAFYIFYEAFARLHKPVAIRPGLMIGVAAVGVAMNGIISLLLWTGSRDLNIRSSFLHMVGDTLSTAAVIVGGWTILVTGKYWIDSALSFGIGALILWSSFGIIRETLNILLEGLPRGMEYDKIATAIGAIPGVRHVHDLHVWSIGSQSHALSCHLAIADIPPSESEQILRNVQECVRVNFHIDHTTLQFEHEICDAANGCINTGPVPIHGDSPNQ